MTTTRASLDHDVETELRRDPGGVYAHCDGATRWRYHAAVAALAVRTGRELSTVARVAADLASVAARGQAPTPATSHVGHYLIGSGIGRLAGELGVRPAARRRLARAVARSATPAFVALVAGVAATLLFALLAVLVHRDLAPSWIALALAAALPIAVGEGSRAARTVLGRRAVPRPLPRLDAAAIPPDTVTLMVIPSLVSTPARADELLDRLARLARAHPDPRLRFALLSDFLDADDETAASDGSVLERMRARVEALNAESRDAFGDRFFVLQRRRTWSRTQRRWIGWERKRGKFLELMRLLDRTGEPTTFDWVFGDLAALRAKVSIPWVITLDEEAWLEPGEAVDLVRAAAHPLNQPWFDERTGRLISGAAILQPALLTVPPPPPAVDWIDAISARLPPRRYRRVQPHFHHDVLGFGVHRGQGALYEVAAYRRLLDGTFPSDLVLQHDLLDGFAAHTTEAHGSFVVQPSPHSYLSQLRRGHRWLRGTFQALPWTLPWVRNERGARIRNPLSAIQRLFIVELALVELAKPGALALLVCGWTVLPGSALFWTAVACPAITTAVVRLALGGVGAGLARVPGRPFARRAGRPPRRRGANASVLAQFPVAFAQVVLALEAVIVSDALARALWRMGISKRRLLDWTPHRALDAARSRSGFRQYAIDAWPSTATGLAVVVLVAAVRPVSLPVAGPFAAAWILAPWILWHADRFIFAPEGADESHR